jgi:8-oxo-dGTP diphosphatase
MKIEKGTAIFLIQNNMILLLKRLTEPCKGCWEVPAGKVDAGETVENTALREVLEETGLVVSLERNLGMNFFPNKIAEGMFESHMFTASIVSGALENKEPTKHEAAQWFSLDTLPENLGSTTKEGLGLINL